MQNDITIFILDKTSASRQSKSKQDAETLGFCVSDNHDDARIVVLHKSDIEEPPPYSNQYLDKLIIVYSGGKLDRSMDRNDEISKKVLYLRKEISYSSFISESDWTNIKQLIQTKNGQLIWKQSYFPEERLDIIPALSILCQGYLAEHGKLEGLDTIQDESIQQKLKALKENTDKQTVKPSWWRKPFAENETEIEETDPTKLKQKAKALKEIIKAECGDQEIAKINDLIAAIYSNQSISDVEMVEKAYNAIAARLTSL